MKYQLSKSTMVRTTGDKTFLFNIDSDDVLIRLGDALTAFPDYLKSPRTMDEVVRWVGAPADDVKVLLEEFSEYGLMEGGSRTREALAPKKILVGSSMVEFMSFEQLLPEGANGTVYASYCACNCCGYCDSCTCSDC